MSLQDGCLIRADNLWKIYPLEKQEVAALRGVSFCVEPNEFLAIMGPSGGGKSTLMNILGCLDAPTKGQYHLKGRLVSALSENELADIRNREIGFVFQVFNLLPRATAFHNVELPLIYKGTEKAEREDKVRRALEMVEMSARMRHRPAELSGGERQRVAIARALVNSPSIILADEPTGNLDTQSSHEIMGLLQQLHGRGATIVMVTHEPDIGDYAERILHLLDGRIASDRQNGMRTKREDL
jgi:putative ABC transport system ATP-binding protein